MTRLEELGEFGLLAELEQRGLAEGIEHDAAVVGGLVVTQDALIEGVHFRFDLLNWRELGARAAAVNLSDLAASGADPLALFVSLGLPPETELEDVLELYAGLNQRGDPFCRPRDVLKHSDGEPTNLDLNHGRVMYHGVEVREVRDVRRASVRRAQ